MSKDHFGWVDLVNGCLSAEQSSQVVVALCGNMQLSYTVVLLGCLCSHITRMSEVRTLEFGGAALHLLELPHHH